MLKKIVLSVVFVFLGLVSYGQTVNGIPLEEIDVDYLQVVETNSDVAFKINVTLYFGQGEGKTTKKVAGIKGKDGKYMKFNSGFDVLNIMSKYGYEFLDSYTTGYSIGMYKTIRTTFVLKKDRSKE